MKRDESAGSALIVNADDFGLARCVNRGIIRAHERGILTSTTLLANGPAFDDAVSLARSAPGLGVGVHLNLVRGRPLTPPAEVPLLVDAGGRFDFPAFRRHLRSGGKGRGDDAAAQAAREYARQIARVRAAGLCPTHVDAERHHARFPALRASLADAAVAGGIGAARNLREPVAWTLRRLGWPGWGRAWRAALLRTYATLTGGCGGDGGGGLRRPDGMLGQCFIGAMTRGPWLRLLARPPAGVWEVMTHPGEYDAAEMSALAGEIGPSWIHAARPAELEALCDPEVRRAASTRRLRDFAIFLS